MLMRSLKVPPSLLLILAFCVFLGIHFSQISLPTQPVPALSLEKKAPRIALVTFVTEERSYLHLALKSKNRE
jgi:mannan polymerase II complex MNN10 subunit